MLKTPRWLYPVGPLTRDRIAVVCFPYAAGSAGIFSSWAGRLPPGHVVAGVELPGRGRRFSEPAEWDVDTVSQHVASAVESLPTQHVVLLGHSMGAVLAYEVARRLAKLGHEVRHLIVAAFPAPFLPRPRHVLSQLPDEEFLRTAVRLGLASPLMTQQAELAEIFTPVLRADTAAIDAYRHRPGPPLHVPVTLLAGDQDPFVSADGLAAWAQVTTAPPRLRWVPGGHLFLTENTAATLAAVRDALASPGAGA